MTTNDNDGAAGAELLARAASYLGNGGFFNPELMDYDKVRDLVMDLSVALRSALRAPQPPYVTSLQSNAHCPPMPPPDYDALKPVALRAPQPQEVEIAERIAREAHAQQRDTVTDAPYITHVERVVAMVDGPQAKAVAWLHDVLEDSDVTSADLVRAGISDDVRIAVERLTRDPLESYAEYISTIRVCGPELARIVKRADLRDHLQPNCPVRLRSRYEAAVAALRAPQEGKAL